jgi:c-di-GMP-related signal transduction protein
MVGRPVSTWIDFDACAALGLDAFVGKLHLTPRPATAGQGLNPTQTIILQLMQMVQNNDDIPEARSVLKRDPALIYKLLRFINSAGFGAGAKCSRCARPSACWATRRCTAGCAAAGTAPAPAAIRRC